MSIVTHYLITNRQIDLIDGQEVIHRTGDENAVDEPHVSFRFAHYTFDTDRPDDEGTVTLVPDLPPPPTVNTLTGTLTANLTTSAPESLNDGSGNPQNAGQLTGSNQVFMELFNTLKEDNTGNVLFFIHGYKTDLAGTLSTIRAIHQKYVQPDSDIQTIITFAWPSRNALLRYKDDQEDAKTSGFALARVYQRLHDFLGELFAMPNAKPCKRYIHLMCHSMGNQVLFYMLERLKMQGLNNFETFKQAVLVGADVPYDSFDTDQPLNRLIDLCEQVHVYYHRQDLALLASSVTKFRENRLGRVGFKNPGQVPADVHEIDITDAPSGDTDSVVKNLLQFDKDNLLQHWTYVSNETVVKDINTVFSTGKSTFGVVSPPYPLEQQNPTDVIAGGGL